MGLTINTLPVLENLATIQSVYVNIRDIRINKPENGNYEFSFWYYLSKDGKRIDAKQITQTSGAVADTLPWAKAYEILKQRLTEQELTYTDDM